MAGLRSKYSRVGTQVAAEHVALADEYGRYSGQALQRARRRTGAEADLALLVGLTDSKHLPGTQQRISLGEISSTPIT